MLSIERCKEILGNKTISDTEIEKLREALYAVVENVVDDYVYSCVNIQSTCKKQLSIAEFPQSVRK